MPYIWEHPEHPGPFPWSHVGVFGSEANGAFRFSHKNLAENYTGDLRVLPAVTSLTGGGTALDGVATASGATVTGAVREVLLGRTVYRYRLVNGADAESVPEVIRPDDYHAGTNNRVWRLLAPVNRTQVAGQPGLAGGYRLNITGCNLDAGLWSAWVRLYVNYRAVNSAALTTLQNASGWGVRLNLSAGDLVLTAESEVGVTEATATAAGFVARYADEVVDLVLVRTTTANPSNHEIQLWCNAELLLTVTIAAARAYTFTQFRPINQNSPEWVTYRAVLFNRALGSADIYRLGQRGVEVADRWGQLAVGYTADWSAGVDSWSASGGGTLAGNLDGLGIPSTDNVLRYTLPATPAATQYVARSVSAAADTYRLCRVTGKVWLPNTNTGADEVRLVTFNLDPYGTDSVRLAGRSAGWVDFDVLVNLRAGTTQLRIHLAFAAGSGTQVEGDTLHLANVTVQQVGVIADADVTFGVGKTVVDRSPNGFHSNSFSSASTWTVPASHGQRTLVLNLAHIAVSATAGSTRILDLPPNCALLRVELERTAAFDSGVTVSIGTSGDDDRYGAATAVDATGTTLVSSLVQTVESATAETGIFLCKSGATTTGNLRVRVTYELRGSPPPIA